MTVTGHRVHDGIDNSVGGSPRIYVVCLSAYNEGNLHGRWIAADQTPEDILEEIQGMLASSDESRAEEWLIHDYDGFGSLQLGEAESLARISAIASGITEHGPAFGGWLAYDSSRDASEPKAFTDAYRGEWESLSAYTEAYAESTGLYEVVEKTASPYIRVDLDALQRDLKMDVYAVPTGHGTVYVFDANVD
jgi:antirestriction protein